MCFRTTELTVGLTRLLGYCCEQIHNYRHEHSMAVVPMVPQPGLAQGMSVCLFRCLFCCHAYVSVICYNYLLTIIFFYLRYVAFICLRGITFI